MSEQLVKSGLFFDELNKVKVIDPEISTKTSELKAECNDFVDCKLLKYYTTFYK